MPDKMHEPDRPYMPDYGITASKKGLLSWEWVDEQMAKSRNYWICSASLAGKPHATPVWGVWLDRVLYFSCARSSRKARNLTANPEITVHLESGDDTVMLEGRASELTDKALRARMVEAYSAKYPPFKPNPEAEPTNLYLAVKPRLVLAWREQDFTNSATRWRLDES
jgi:nitroimidazol reductase NimA-like FMN-containing flavoprotein (pyridoxamine 5'-phosphate oxidase superfamily)